MLALVKRSTVDVSPAGTMTFSSVRSVSREGQFRSPAHAERATNAVAAREDDGHHAFSEINNDVARASADGF